jgi:predicted Fe-S protein YdhL (DUF1289 family)
LAQLQENRVKRAQESPMESPCTKICTYDPESGLCHGCGRTLEEIGAWFSMTDAERRAVMIQLPERLKRFAAPAS